MHTYRPSIIRMLLGAMMLISLSGCATSGTSAIFGQDLPRWVHDVRSSKDLCTDAAAEAKAKALAMGIAPDRMSWLYGRKPFEKVGHVSLVIDGWMVVDNGGLGRNVWGERICISDVCTLSEVQRAYEESFIESAALALRVEFGQGEWTGRVATGNRIAATN